MYKLPHEYFVLDFETTGLPKGNDVSHVDIIEIAYIHSPSNLKVSKFARPPDPLPKKIIEITHITDDMLVGADTPLETARQTFPALLNSDAPIVGHNIVGFDRYFLDKYCVLLGLPKIDIGRYIDTAALFKTYRRGHRAKSPSYNLPSTQKDFFVWSTAILEKSWTEDAIKYNLDAALGYLAIPQFGIASERHRAMYDVISTQRVLEELRKEMSL